MIATCAVAEHWRHKSLQLFVLSVAVNMCLIVRNRLLCHVNGCHFTIYCVSFFRTEIHTCVKCHRKNETIWAMILRDCYTLITLLESRRNLCTFVYQDARNKSFLLCRMEFALCAYFSLSTEREWEISVKSMLSWIQQIIEEYDVCWRCLVLASRQNTNLLSDESLRIITYNTLLNREE